MRSACVAAVLALALFGGCGGEVNGSAVATRDARATDAPPAPIEAGPVPDGPVSPPAIDSAPPQDAPSIAPKVDSGGPVDATVTPDAPLPVLASCADVLAANPAAESGVYMIAPPGAGQYEAYCDMTLAGGGWTVFFAGITGSPNVFAHFEDVAVDCPDPTNKCLRRIPSSLPTNALFAASCGSNAASFNIDSPTFSYLSEGVQGGGWRPTSNGAALAGDVPLSYVGNLWTVNGTNEGWILSSTATDANRAATFGSSYDLNTNWDYCDGVSDTTSQLRLYYR